MTDTAEPLVGTVWSCDVHGVTDAVVLGGISAHAYCGEDGCSRRATLTSSAFKASAAERAVWATAARSPFGHVDRPFGPPSVTVSEPRAPRSPRRGTAGQPGTATAAGAVVALLRAREMTPAQVADALRGGPHAATGNNPSVILQYLKRRGLVESPRYGVWRAIR